MQKCGQNFIIVRQSPNDVGLAGGRGRIGAGEGGKWKHNRSESVHMLISFDVFKHVRLTAKLIAEPSWANLVKGNVSRLRRRENANGGRKTED